MATASKNRKEALVAAIRMEDVGSLREAARHGAGRVVRRLTGQLYSSDPETKQRAVRMLGAIAGDSALLDARRARDLLQRFAWALNDESGAVPYGIPEAMGEVLATRPEFQESFLPILCSLLTEPEMSQTGAVELGAIWAVGRVGAPVALCSREAVEAVRLAARSHPDPKIRETAARSLEQIEQEGCQS